MITFYEGLPRSGKSFSAMRDEILPRIKTGRKVFAYLEGINHEQIAKLAGITEDRCKELLHALTREQVPEIYKHVENDSLVVIDEIQNFFPTKRQPLESAITQFVTEHGHRGLDIVIMGQSIKDVHSLWRRRCESKIYFLKKSAFGKPNEYSATVFRVVPYKDDVKYESVMTSNNTYDPAFFGTYKSHTDGTKNKETHIDPRGIIWNHPLFKRWLPITAALTIILIAYVWNLFNGGLEKSLIKEVKAEAEMPKTRIFNPQVAAMPASVPAPEPEKQIAEPTPPADIVQELSQKNRIRLIGYWKDGAATNALIEWRDSGAGLVHSMNSRDLSGLGWNVFVNQDGTIATMQKGSVRLIATSWQIDTRQFRTSETTQRRVSGKEEGIGEAFISRPVSRMVDADSLQTGT